MKIHNTSQIVHYFPSQKENPISKFFSSGSNIRKLVSWPAIGVCHDVWSQGTTSQRWTWERDDDFVQSVWVIWKQIKQILVLTLAHCLVDISTVKTNRCLEVSFSFAKAFEFNSTRKKSFSRVTDADDFLGELQQHKKYLDWFRTEFHAPFCKK